MENFDNKEENENAQQQKLVVDGATDTGNPSPDGQEGSIQSKQVSGKVQTLRNSKKFAKTQLTKAKKQLNDLIDKQVPDVPLPSKNAIRRTINKVNTEVNIIEKIISELKEAYAMNAGSDECNTIIESLDKELQNIGSSVDAVIVSAEKHIQERLSNGEAESVLMSVHSKMGSAQSPAVSKKSANFEKRQKEADEASERLVQMENEQKQKEIELEKLTVELQLSKQRTEEARKIVDLNQLRAEAAEQEVDLPDDDTVQNFLEKETKSGYVKSSAEDTKYNRLPAPIRLKGVEIPKFSGEDKSDYESWKTTFMFVVDLLNIPTGEKMLRL